MLGMHVIAAVGVPDDYRDRVGLDNQVLGQLPRLVGGGLGGGLVGLSDRDQVCH